jgi:hypothetical protein
MKFVIDLLLPVALGPRGRLNLEEKCVPEVSTLGLKRPVPKDDKRATFIYLLSRNSGSLNLLKCWVCPGLHRVCFSFTVTWDIEGQIRVVLCSTSSEFESRSGDHCTDFCFQHFKLFSINNIVLPWNTPSVFHFSFFPIYHLHSKIQLYRFQAHKSNYLIY